MSVNSATSGSVAEPSAQASSRAEHAASCAFSARTTARCSDSRSSWASPSSRSRVSMVEDIRAFPFPYTALPRDHSTVHHRAMKWPGACRPVAQIVKNMYIAISYPQDDRRGDSRGFQHGIWWRIRGGRFLRGCWCAAPAAGVQRCFRRGLRLQGPCTKLHPDGARGHLQPGKFLQEHPQGGRLPESPDLRDTLLPYHRHNRWLYRPDCLSDHGRGGRLFYCWFIRQHHRYSD